MHFLKKLNYLILNSFGVSTNTLSAFDRARGNALYDILLAGQIEYDDRDYAEQNQCHGRAEVNRAVAALQVLDMNRDGSVFIDVEHQNGEQVIVPYPHNFQDSD